MEQPSSQLLFSSAPAFCTAQRFNLFLAKEVGVKAPLLGGVLEKSVRGLVVNPFYLGALVVALQGKQLLEPNFNLFNRDVEYFSYEHALADFIKIATQAGSLELVEGLTPNILKEAHLCYLKFVRFSQKLAGAGQVPTPVILPRLPDPVSIPVQESPTLPIPDGEAKAKPSVPSVPSVPVVVNPPLIPQPKEKPQPVEPKPKWKSTVKIISGTLLTAVTMLAILIPDYIELPLKLLLKFLLEFAK